MASEGPTPRPEREPPTGDADVVEGAEKPPVDGGEPLSGTAAASEVSPDAPALAAYASEAPEHVSEPPVPEHPVEAQPIPPPPRPPVRPPRRRSVFWPMLGSAIFGAILALAALAFVWRYNVLEPYNIDLGGKLARARFAALEARVRDLQTQGAPVSASAPAPVVSQPAAAPADTKLLDELTARVAKLETAVQNPKPPPPDIALASRFVALEGAIKPLNDGLAAANKRADEIATSLGQIRSRLDATGKAIDDVAAAQRQHPSADKADLDKLDARLVTLETATKSLAATTAAAGAADKGADRNLRAAVFASALRSAVIRGVPYAVELAGLKSQIADPQVLAPLEPFAATGTPSPAALAKELTALLPAIARAAEPPPSATGEGTFMQRLRSRASEFIQTRPVGEAPGDDPIAVVARLNVDATRADITAALADLGKLPADAKAPAQAFIAKVQARAAAIAAAQRVAADALAALGKS
jgi:hypothetical protein